MLTAARHRTLTLGFAFAAVVTGSAEGGAESRPAPARVEAVRADQPVEVDGLLTDTIWQTAPIFEIAIETRPAENGPAPVRTTLRAAFDANHLWFAFEAFDPDPSQIRANYSDRDRAFQDDIVGVILDTFNDERRAYEFFSNPLGVQMDLVQNDITGNEDESWDAIWDSAGKITANGYVVEMEIPLSSLRFPASQGAQIWGIDALRLYPRGARYRLGLVPMRRDRNCYLCAIGDLVGLDGIRPARDFELDPTLTSTRTDARELFPDGPLIEGEEKVEGGLTARWGITPNIQLLGTINPDFSQVEADAAQLDVNTQFALFFPEKRPFFLEGADSFDTKLQVVYTRNVADPNWGLKLSGKVGADGFGAIVTEDDRTNFVFPGAEGSRFGSVDDQNVSTVLRYRRDLSPTATMGVIYTGREGDDYHNRVLGIDSLFRFGDKYALRVEAFGSDTRYSDTVATEFDQPTDALRAHGIRLGFSRSTRDWYTYAAYFDIGDQFRADLGFVPRVDYRQGVVGTERIFLGEQKHWYDELRIGGDYDETQTQSGDLLEREIEAWVFFQGPWQSEGMIRPGYRTVGFAGQEFDQASLFAFLSARPTAMLTVGLEGEIGDAIDYANARRAERVSLAPTLSLNLGRHLRTSLSHTFERLEVDAWRLFTANLTEVRTTYQFNLRCYVRWVSQLFDLERDPSLYGSPVESDVEEWFNQLLFSYKVNPQTLLFVGYSDSSFGNSSIDLTRADRTFFVKLGYAWRL